MSKHLATFAVVVILVGALVSWAPCADAPAGGTDKAPVGQSGSDNTNYDTVAPEYSAPPEYSAKEYTNPGMASAPAPTPPNRENGIVVGQPKLFEPRSLQMMIDSVKASLAQTAYPDASQLYGMAGHIQGGQIASQGQAAQIMGPPGSGGSNSSVLKPTLPEISSTAGSDLQARMGFSMAPTDLMAEQTSLWYQLANLRMLMDGALSDRLVPTDDNGDATGYGGAVGFSPRAQAIVGFQISVDPRQDYRNAVAEAIITIDSKNIIGSGAGGYGNEPSLMMLLPRDKTYNTVSINRDSKSFGMGSVVNVFSLGFAQEKKREMFFIGKDTDTVALERIPWLPVYGKADPNLSSQHKYRGVSFGWQFRPVFNRASVDPGVRQVFAMISLPASLTEAKWDGRVHVTTYWRKYDRSSGTVGKPFDETINEWDLDDIVVPIGSGIENALQPRITRAAWEDTGRGNVAITLEGSNFALGTAVTCGEITLDEKDLSLCSANRVRFTAPATPVVRGGITVIGRYGVADVKACAGKSDDPYAGIQVSAPRLTQMDGQTTAVEMTLSNVQDAARLVSDRRPVLEIGGELFGFGDRPFASISANQAGKTVTLKCLAPADAVARTHELVVRDLVGPTALAVKCGGSDDCVVSKAVVLSTGNPVSVALFGSGFGDDVKVIVGGKEVRARRVGSPDGPATVVTFEIDRETAANARFILVTQGKKSPILTPFTMTETPPQTAAAAGGQPASQATAQPVGQAAGQSGVPVGGLMKDPPPEISVRTR